MRTAFIETLLEVADQDPRVWLLTGDLGYSVLEPFAQCFPNRYVNVGVAEQNMTGIAAGLALTGKTVFTYSIANFPVMRCLEQIRNDVCYHNLSVKIVAVGGGMAYASAGYSHFAVEDLAVTRVLPNMRVLAPGDPIEARAATRSAAHQPGPCYIRLGKAGERKVHPEGSTPDVSRAIELRNGSDATIIVTGGMLADCVDACDLLQKAGLSIRLLSMPSVEPMDAQAISAACRDTKAIVTVEEHGRGGLADAVAVMVAGSGVRFGALRLENGIPTVAGSHDQMKREAGLTSDAIARRVSALFGTAARDRDTVGH